MMAFNMAPAPVMMDVDVDREEDMMDGAERVSPPPKLVKQV